MTWQNGLYAWMALGALLMLVQFKLTPAYGRHTSAGWGPMLPNRLGWVMMESMALLSFWIGWWLGDTEWPASALALTAMVLWNLHYVHRALIFPFRTQTHGKQMPVVIMLSALAFNAVNGCVISLGLQALPATAPLAAPSLLGLLLFLGGAWINIRADNTLLALRTRHDQGYHIPRGGAFEWVSCPNFSGEILQWCGFALLCWNLPALAFAVWTAANLIPRALAHHRWYRKTFVDYPSRRKALIPFLL